MTKTWVRRAKQKMRERKVTQEDLATVLGKSTRGAVGHYFTGRSEPTLDQLSAIAKHLGVSLTWLVSENGTEVEVDDNALELCIKLIEEAKEENNIQLDAQQTASLSVYLYQLLKEGEDLSPLKTSNIIKLMLSSKLQPTS